MKWLGWAGGAVALLVLLLLGIWMIDPPWRISEIEGLVVGAGNRIAPSVVAQYYKMHLLVKTEDGRNIGVFSERHVPPPVGTRLTIQERVGLLGTRTFIEIPTK